MDTHSDRNRLPQLSARQLNMLVQALPLGVAYVDHEERVLYVNDAFARFAGSVADAVPGVSLREILGVPSYVQLRPCILAALAGHQRTLGGWVRCAGYPASSTFLPDRAEDGSISGCFALIAERPDMPREEGARYFRATPQSISHSTSSPCECLRRLTPRECDVLTRLMMGKLNKTVAAELRISPRTVEAHRAHILKKLGIRKISQAARMTALVEAEDG